MITITSKLTNLIVFILCVCFASTAYSYDTGQSSVAKQERKYDRKFRKNYRKYKTFSPKKKQRFQRLNKSVRGLTPEQKRRLRERVLKKNKPSY